MADRTLSDLRELPQERWMKDETYYAFSCSKCGADARNTYSEPPRSQLLERRLCYTCNHWHNMAERLERDHASMTIIDGHIYTPGNRTTGQFRGMGGRRFDIEYIEPSRHAGKRITTFDLWSGSTMPGDLCARFADTARFLGDVSREQVGDTTCWNSSNGTTEPYPLPITIGVGND